MVSDTKLKNAKPKDKDYCIYVDKGLFLLVKSTGSKLWRFRYSYAKRRSMVSLGQYPVVSIRKARMKVQAFQDLLDDGINPSSFKQAERVKLEQERCFRDVAIDWHAKHYQGSHVRHRQLVLRRLEKYVFPLLGKLPIRMVEASMVFSIIESIQDKGYIETARRVNGYCSMVFRYGVAKGFCSRDVTRDYEGMLKAAQSVHMPAITDPIQVGELLRDMQAYQGKWVTKTALLISAYIFVRPSELASSQWAFIDFSQSHWIIPAECMKMKRDHLIPFPHQVKTLLEALYALTGQGRYVFPNEKDACRPMHSESVNKCIRRIENGKYVGRMVSHGFRAMASTLLNEQNRFRGDVIEKQLAHQERNAVRGAYNHAVYLDERTEMMQWYADYLDGLAASV